MIILEIQENKRQRQNNNDQKTMVSRQRMSNQFSYFQRSTRAASNNQQSQPINISLYLKKMNGVKVTRQFISLSFSKNDFGRNRNMVIHHGLMGSSKNFKTISKNQHISSYVNSYLIDCRNHGDSPHTESHSIQDLADDIHNFILEQDLQKKQGLILMGHSMGGMALMKFTQKYPQVQQFINRIILIDIHCQPNNNDKSINNTGQMLKKMGQINLNQKIDKVFKEIQLRASSKDVAGLIKTNIKIEGQSSHKWISNISTIVRQYHHLSSFRLKQNKWRKPIQMIYGVRSNYVNDSQIKRYCQLYPQMQKENFYPIENAGHWVHFENTSKFLQTVQEILKKDF